MSADKIIRLVGRIKGLPGHRHLAWEHPRLAAEMLNRLPQEYVVEVRIKKAGRPRSTLQNGFYWGCLIPMAAKGFEDMGHEIYGVPYTHDQVHEIFLKMFSPGKRSSAMTTDENNEFQERIRGWCCDNLNINIPYPDPDWRTK